LKIIPEIDLTQDEDDSIVALRNDSFPDFQVPRSYYKQLPHYRCLEYEGRKLVGYMGLDYRVFGVGGISCSVLGVIDFCIRRERRGSGLGSLMLSSLSEYAKDRPVDFIVLVSDLDEFYGKNGYQKIVARHSWLRLDEFKNYGIAQESVEGFYLKPVSGKVWPGGPVDWLGYMF